MNAATRRLRAAQAGVAGFALGLLLLASLSEAAYWKDIQFRKIDDRTIQFRIEAPAAAQIPPGAFLTISR